jgi:hypothetical protein
MSIDRYDRLVPPDRHNGGMSALTFSIVASIVLTIVLNVAIRAFPGIGEWMHDRMARLAERTANDVGREPDRRRVHVYFPWKAMLITSVVLTVAINLVLILFR